MRTTKKYITLFVVLAVLAGVSACTQSAPNMIDYSYVPQNHDFTVVTAATLEDF